jgi:uncharacterized Rossmann fold enzyme
MAFGTWEPVYEQILAEFGYDRAADELARDRLDSLTEENAVTPVEALDFRGQVVAVAGGADRLADDLAAVGEADAVIAASVAADRLRETGVAVDCMVTDLDKNPDTARELTAAGTPVAVHAHGDNIPAVEAHVPTFDHSAMLPTTQAAPAGAVANYGGFTDGDRAAVLADAFGADRLVFPGWAFDDPGVTEEKALKLRWAEQLLYWLERRRDERFAVLDGRRTAVDTAPLPV